MTDIMSLWYDGMPVHDIFSVAGRTRPEKKTREIKFPTI